MTISTTTVAGAPPAAEATGTWLSEYRRLLKNPAPGMLDLFQLLAQAAEIFHDTERAWSAMFPLPHRIRDAHNPSSWPYPVITGDRPGGYWVAGYGPDGSPAADLVNGPLSPDDPGQGGLSVPHPPFQRDGDDG